ncbi:glycosyltransferase [[Ruminococcus] lactaris]|uniref:glycosyltransferase n=1 Tax=[Ruminococcus] lactaris TaxID=46228 RepID=UPI00307C14C4
MKKGIYLVYDSLDLEHPDGIERKIISQKEAIESIPAHVDFHVLKRVNGTYWNYEPIFSGYDFVYFRKGTIDWRLEKYLRKIKLENPNMIIYMDIPTYPYEGEMGAGFKANVKRLIDKVFRERLYRYIDRIVVTGSNIESSLWNIKVVNIVNGINMDEINIRKVTNKKNESVLTISCIARFSPWHGYERLIRGLASYYNTGGTRDIKVLMVGQGSEIEMYKELVQKNKLDDRIIFTGQLLGEQLEEIYDLTDIGCCSLGRYKSGLDVIGDLKSREFMAKGIPMICGCNIDVLENTEYPYVVQFPNDSSEIDFKHLIDYYDSLIERFSIDELTEAIRLRARDLVDFRKTFSPVINELKEQLS